MVTGFLTVMILLWLYIPDVNKHVDFLVFLSEHHKEVGSLSDTTSLRFNRTVVYVAAESQDGDSLLCVLLCKVYVMIKL